MLTAVLDFMLGTALIISIFYNGRIEPFICDSYIRFGKKKHSLNLL